MPSSLYPLRWVLILLIAFQVFWLASDLFDSLFNLPLYELIPDAAWSALRIGSNCLELVFYVMLLGLLGKLAFKPEA